MAPMVSTLERFHGNVKYMTFFIHTITWKYAPHFKDGSHQHVTS